MLICEDAQLRTFLDKETNTSRLIAQITWSDVMFDSLFVLYVIKFHIMFCYSYQIVDCTMQVKM